MRKFPRLLSREVRSFRLVLRVLSTSFPEDEVGVGLHVTDARVMAPMGKFSYSLGLMGELKDDANANKNMQLIRPPLHRRQGHGTDGLVESKLWAA